MKAVTLLLTVALLTCCACSSRKTSDSMTLYSPPFIRLKAGSEVRTADGIYKPQVDEVWHSDAEYQRRVVESLK